MRVARRLTGSHNEAYSVLLKNLKEKEIQEELAIFGGRPKFDPPLHVGRPNLGNRERLFERMTSLLDRRQLSNNGPFVQEFEKRIREKTGVTNCIAVVNATIALEVTAKAMGFKGEVIVPSFTFVATAHAMRWIGLDVVFADMLPDDHTIDPASVAKLITPRTTAIVATHVWGKPCRIMELTALAKRHNLHLIFDAAHAFGVKYNGTNIGHFGTAEIFSFHATKHINSFEGGAICTNDDQLAAKIRLMINFGFSGYDNVVCLGTNGKMHEASAAMGLTSLESFDETTNKNKRTSQVYERELRCLHGIRVLTHEPTNEPNYHYVVLEVNPYKAQINRDQLCDILVAEGVFARKYFWPGAHRAMPYRDEQPEADTHLPVVGMLSARVLVLPNSANLDERDVSTICGIIKHAVHNAASIKER